MFYLKTIQRDRKKEILYALDQIERISCVKFVTRTNETDFVQVEVCHVRLFQFVFRLIFLFPKAKNSRCYSQVGRQGGKQVLNLELVFGSRFGCLQTGVIMHELLHSEHPYSIIL